MEKQRWEESEKRREDSQNCFVLALSSSKLEEVSQRKSRRIDSFSNLQIDRQAGRQADRQTDRRTEDRQTDRQAGRQAGRQTETDR